MLQKVSVKPIKIKSIIFNPNNLDKLGSSSFSKTHIKSQSSLSRSQLKNLSQQRDRKKRSKLLDQSFDTESFRSCMMENISNLEQQYSKLKKASSSHKYIKAEGKSHYVLHSKIDLQVGSNKQQQSNIRKKLFVQSNNKLDIISIGHENRIVKKKKGIKLCRGKITQLLMR